MSRGLPFEIGRSPKEEVVVRLSTSLTYENAARVWEGLNGLIRGGRIHSLVLDLSGADRIDSAGIALLQATRRLCDRGQIPVRFESLPPSAQHFLEYFKKAENTEAQEPAPVSGSFITRLGIFSIARAGELREFFHFSKDFFKTASRSVFRGRRSHWREVAYYLQITGADAMTILFLIMFLLGVVMAYQAAIQLRQFGANIYVADLVSIALARELAPMFTGMLLAGRSGSAFAAEIGTMKIGEEIDALSVMGFELTEFITLPKVLALMIAAPLLTMWSNFAGIAGSIAVAAVSLDLTAYSFMQEVYTAVIPSDILSGLIKAEVFAVLVALIGCFRGFQTGLAADSVGRQTTSAVVSGLFLIIFSDAFLTILFHAFGW